MTHDRRSKRDAFARTIGRPTLRLRRSARPRTHDSRLTTHDRRSKRNAFARTIGRPTLRLRRSARPRTHDSRLTTHDRRSKRDTFARTIGRPASVSARCSGRRSRFSSGGATRGRAKVADQRCRSTTKIESTTQTATTLAAANATAFARTCRPTGVCLAAV